MNNLLHRFMTAVLLSLLLLPSAVHAADPTAAALPDGPLLVVADNLNFNQETGDIYAAGNVRITQNTATLLADVIEANTRSHDIWAAQTAEVIRPAYRFTGDDIRYNYTEKNGSIANFTGQINKLYTAGTLATLTPDEIVITNGSITACPAQIPDYHLSAKKIEVWPNDKLIAYHVTVWFKNTALFSLPKYQLSLQKTTDSSPLPRLGFSAGDGFYLKQSLTYPLTASLAFTGDLAYYSHAKFKPSYQLIDQQKNYQLGVYGGYFRDADGNWLEKCPELTWTYTAHRFTHLPVSYTLNATIGQWSDAAKSSVHEDYHFYLNADPLRVGSSELAIGLGFQQVHESYDHSATNSLKLDATLTSPLSSSLSTIVGYHYNSNIHSLFAYDSPAAAKELVFGVNWHIDPLNELHIQESYDVTAHRITDIDYTWKRNLHCFAADLTYRATRKQVLVAIRTAKL